MESKLGTILKVMLCLWLIKWVLDNCLPGIIVVCLLGIVVCGIGATVDRVKEHYASVELAEWGATSAAAASTACVKSGGEPKWCTCMFADLYKNGPDVSRRLTRGEQDHPESDPISHGSFGDYLVKAIHNRCTAKL